MKETTKIVLVLVGIFGLLIASVVLFFVDRKDTESREITIVDKTDDVCAEAIFFFYTDDKYNYYFDCLKEIYIQVDGNEYEVGDALENKVVTVDELADAGLKFYRSEIEE